jgi:hypothetical protein
VNEGQLWANSRQRSYILEALVQGLPPFVIDAREQVMLSNREHEIVSKVTPKA